MRAPIMTQKRARKLRVAMSRPEEMLWAMLREKQTGLRFRRQHPLGVYILDFYAPSAKLCIEVDGPSHDDLERIKHDRHRDEWLAGQGIRVFRVTTRDVEERLPDVMTKIRAIARGTTD
jgi:very-short-patch-repair endonuclease